MSKSISAPLLRTARLLDLVPYLNSHQGVALKELAQHFSVTPAQMSADLTTLWMCGLPGYTPLELMDLEFESGYVTIRNASTLSKPRQITFQEVVALLLGLDLVVAAIADDRKDLINAAAALRQRLVAHLGVPIKVSVRPQTLGSVSTAISKAISSNSGLSIRYHSLYKDEVSDRLISPIELYEVDQHLYLRAYCATAQDHREFRVDRIAEAAMATLPEETSITPQVAQKIIFSITIDQRSRDVAERFGIAKMKIGELINLSSYSALWIERSVLASGGAVTLQSPEQIRTEVCRKAQLMLKRYKGD